MKDTRSAVAIGQPNGTSLSRTPTPETRHPAPARRAFTLVELLVVIAVIALLGSLVLTASIRAMDMAKQAQCRSNMNQIGKAFFLYLHCYEQWMVAIGTPAGHYKWWYDALADETGNPKIFSCPTKPQTRLGYGYNVRYADPFGNKHCWNQTLQFNIVRSPEGTIAFADAGNVVNFTDDPEKWRDTDALPIEAKVRFPYSDADPYWGITCSRTVPRHHGQANCLMFDGAVQSHRPADILRHKYGEAGCIFDNQ